MSEAAALLEDTAAPSVPSNGELIEARPSRRRRRGGQRHKAAAARAEEADTLEMPGDMVDTTLFEPAREEEISAEEAAMALMTILNAIEEPETAEAEVPVAEVTEEAAVVVVEEIPAPAEEPAPVEPKAKRHRSAAAARAQPPR